MIEKSPYMSVSYDDIFYFPLLSFFFFFFLFSNEKLFGVFEVVFTLKNEGNGWLNITTFVCQLICKATLLKSHFGMDIIL